VDFKPFTEEITLSNDVTYTIEVDSDIDKDIDEMIAYVTVTCKKKMEHIRIKFFDASKLKVRAYLMNERLKHYMSELQDKIDRMKRNYEAS
jgi:hypothetical protein